jgi:hypothetical protein
MKVGSTGVEEKIWLKIGNWDSAHGIGRIVSPLPLRGDEGNIDGH